MGILDRLFDNPQRRVESLARDIVDASHTERLTFLQMCKQPTSDTADAELLFAFCFVCIHWVDRVARVRMGGASSRFVSDVWSATVELLVAHGTGGKPRGAMATILRQSLNDGLLECQELLWRTEYQADTKLVEGSMQFVMGHRLAAAAVPDPSLESIRLGAILAVEVSNSLSLGERIK